MNSKYMVLLLMVTLVFCGCKKRSCTGVVCSGGKTCIDGECQFLSLYDCGLHEHPYSGHCVCDSGWWGANCQFSSTNGSHGHWGGGSSYVCDSGWTGLRCEVPIGLFVGTYHISGSYHYWDPWNSITNNINRNTQIQINGDTLFEGVGKFMYYTLMHYSYPGDTNNYYCFIYGGKSLLFSKTHPDSIYYSYHNSGIGAGETETWSGIKMH